MPSITQSNYTPNIIPRSLSTLLTTRLAIENEHVAIVDSRSKDEYDGKYSKAKNKGHIPKAINIPWDLNLLPTDGTFKLKTKEDLEKIYAKLKHFDDTIVYCNFGKESALTYLIMRSMGRRVSVYDGAWLEWGNDLSLPVEHELSREQGSGVGSHAQ